MMTKKKPPASKLIELILLKYEDGSGIKLSELTKKTMKYAYTNNFNKRRDYISRVLSWMNDQSRVERVKRGYWKLTEHRKKYLEGKAKGIEREKWLSSV